MPHPDPKSTKTLVHPGESEAAPEARSVPPALTMLQKATAAVGSDPMARRLARRVAAKAAREAEKAERAAHKREAAVAAIERILEDSAKGPPDDGSEVEGHFDEESANQVNDTIWNEEHAGDRHGKHEVPVPAPPLVAPEKGTAEALIEAFRIEAREHSEQWKQSGSIRDNPKVPPPWRGNSYDGLPKCNIAAATADLQAGMIPFGYRPDGTIKDLSVNDIVAVVEKLKETGAWDSKEEKFGVQCGEVVDESQVAPGDYVIIAAEYRMDTETTHGHIELLTEVRRDEAGHVLTSVHGIGAGSRGGMHETDYAKRTTFGKKSGNCFEMNQHTLFFRKWPLTRLTNKDAS